MATLGCWPLVGRNGARGLHAASPVGWALNNRHGLVTRRVRSREVGLLSVWGMPTDRDIVCGIPAY